MAHLTQDEADAIRDASVAQWWKNWHLADYSWDGLTQYSWQGWAVVEDKATYDAYIKTYGLPDGCPNRACQVIPVGYDGLPKATQTRPATLQDYWRDQDSTLQKADGQKTYTTAHLPTHYKDGEKSWKSDPDHQNWHALSELISQRLAFGVKTDVTVISKDEEIVGQDGRTNFRGCVLASVRASKAKFDPKAVSQTPSISDRTLHLSLCEAAILQSQNFNDTIFGSTANFDRSLFAGEDTAFIDAQFSGGSAQFNDAKFSGDSARFTFTKFSNGDADFRNAQFVGGDVDFFHAEFSGGCAYFTRTQFAGGDAAFGDADFSGGSAYFSHAVFLGDVVDFSGARFSGGIALFSHVVIAGPLNFHRAIFTKRADFENAQFPTASDSHDAFRGCQFNGPAKFNRTIYLDHDESPLPPSKLHFPFNAFGRADFNGQLTLTQRGDSAAHVEFNRALASMADACLGKSDDFKEAHYVALESGCTTLKRAMETVSDKNRAQRYFKFELMARQRRPSTPLMVKLFTKLYGLSADYGGSIARPLWTLLFLWLGFAAIYGVNAQFAHPELSVPNQIWGAVDFSATHIFRPLFIWSETVTGEDISWLSQYRAGLTTGGWLFIKLLATLQSFLSLTLFFLFGLATKRRFQIS